MAKLKAELGSGSPTSGELSAGSAGELAPAEETQPEAQAEPAAPEPAVPAFEESTSGPAPEAEPGS